MATKEQIFGRAISAIYAFTLNSLHEFSPSGGDGVVEIRIVGGVPQAVYVRAITEEEKSVPKNVRGKIANWELSDEDFRRVFKKTTKNTHVLSGYEKSLTSLYPPGVKGTVITTFPLPVKGKFGVAVLPLSLNKALQTLEMLRERKRAARMPKAVKH